MNKEGAKNNINSINERQKSKKGQVTIFIIIAIVIIGVAILFFFLIPETKVTPGFDEQNPSAFIQTCIEDKISGAVETVSLQGGSIEPINSILYQNSKVEYLCYTTEYYVPCIVQQPLLQQHIILISSFKILSFK